MNELQKKVLVFLLQELKEQVREMSCDEAEVPSLSDGERLEITRQLWDMWGDVEEWSGEAYRDFGVGSLSKLAQLWITGEK